MKSENKLIGIGLFSAIAASLCCIAPVLALIAGVSGFASTFSWLEPARPYFIGLTILILAFTWYQKLKLQDQVYCNCETSNKPKFIHSKRFLAIVTVFAGLMLAFPMYANIFYPKTEKQVVVVEKSNIQTGDFKIKGMTCSDCERPIKNQIDNLSGVIQSTVSYGEGSAVVRFDNLKTSTSEIEKAINATGYRVTGQKLK